MTYKENIKAILQCYFTGFKEEIIDSACNRIIELEPINSKMLVCPACGLDVHIDFKTCPRCGANMCDLHESEDKRENNE